MAKIPKFRTLEEAAAFWDTHDFEDYRQDTEPVSMTVHIPRRKKILTVPVDRKVYQQIESLAAKKRRPLTEMVSAWLKERASKETARK